QEALFEFVRSGHGYVSIHAADNAAPDWLPTWKEMLGGVFSHIGLPDGKTRKGSFTVKIVDTSGPITRGLKDFPIQDELYYHVQMQPDVQPLATIDYQGVAWPVAWTRTFGKGRVFHTVLGHRDFGPDKHDPLRDPNLSRLVIQGVDWVAAGRAELTWAAKWVRLPSLTLPIRQAGQPDLREENSRCARPAMNRGCSPPRDESSSEPPRDGRRASRSPPATSWAGRDTSRPAS